MTPMPRSLRPARLLGLLTPLAVLVAVMVLLLLPNLIMHMGVRSDASTAASPHGNGAASQSAAATVQSLPVMR